MTISCRDCLDPSGVRKTSWVGSHTIETTSRLAIFTTTRDPRDADVTQETHSVMTEQANQSTQNLAARAAEPSGEDRCRLPSRVRTDHLRRLLEEARAIVNAAMVEASKANLKERREYTHR